MSTRQSVEDVNLSTCQLVNLSTCNEIPNITKCQMSWSDKFFVILSGTFSIFCHFLSTFTIFLHLFGTFHNCWQFLPPSSNFWQILPSFVFSLEFFFIFANFDIVWLLLVSFGNFLQFFLQLLPGFDSFEQFFAMFWQPLTILGKFGYFWQLLANLSFSGQILIFLPAFGCSHKLWATFMNFLWLSPLFGNICQC